MARRGCGTLLKGSGKDQTIWKLEWTYTDGSGAVLLDATQSDEDPTIATPVAYGGTGITSIRFPKATRVWVQHCSVEAAVAGTSEKSARPGSIVATSGTMNVVINTPPSTLADPPSGARGRLVLLLECP